MSRNTPSPVVVLAAGAALTVGLTACKKETETSNPPPPPRTENPPPPPETTALPTWESVESGHPEGATNPPMPVLVVHESGDPCFKAWYDPRAVPPEARAKGGIVLGPGEEAPERATQVQCPDGQVAEVLGRHAEVEAAAQQPVELSTEDAPSEGGGE